MFSNKNRFLSSHGIGVRWLWVIYALWGLCLTLASLSVAFGLTFHHQALSSLDMSAEEPIANRDARLAMRAALLFESNNAGYWYHRAMFFAGDNACEEPGKGCADAIKSLNNAVRLHPIWAFAWARLAALYADDRQFIQAIRALRGAVRFGQYEDFVRNTVVAIGFAYWDQVDDEGRSFLSATLEAMLDHNEFFVVRAVDRLVIGDRQLVMFTSPELHERYLTARAKCLAQWGARCGR